MVILLCQVIHLQADYFRPFSRRLRLAGSIWCGVSVCFCLRFVFVWLRPFASHRRQCLHALNECEREERAFPNSLHVVANRPQLCGFHAFLCFVCSLASRSCAVFGPFVLSFSLHSVSMVTLRYKAIGLPHSKKRVLKNVTSAELLSEQAISKETEPCVVTETRSRELEANPTHVRRLTANPVTLTARPVCFTKGTIPALERKWKIIPSCPTYAGRTLSTAISKKRLQNWYFILIKMNGKLMQPYIGIREDLYY